MPNTRSIRTFAIIAAAALLTFAEVKAQAAEVSYKYATVDNIKIFYREAGDPDKPALLLLHGFPSSSHQFRDLTPLLSDYFHVVAPDYPGMGYSEAPPADKFTPTFDNLTKVMTDFVEKLGDKHPIVYMIDFGGPVGMRMAVSHPDWISGLVFQSATSRLTASTQPGSSGTRKTRQASRPRDAPKPKLMSPWQRPCSSTSKALATPPR